MKRILSSILAILMVFSVFSCLSVTASAALTDQESKIIYEIKTEGFKNGQITYDVYLAPNQTINTALLTVYYNNEIFSVVEEKTGAAKAVDSSGDEYDVVSGEYAHGTPPEKPRYYTFAFMKSQDYKVGTTAKKFVTITFKLNDGKEGKRTSVEFYKGAHDECVEENVIQKFSNFITLETPELKSVKIENGAIYFDWYPVEAAKGGYFVYKVVDGELTTLVNGTTSTSYRDKKALVDGTTYTYAIASRDGLYGEPSMKYEFKVTYFAPPETTASIVEKGINVKWSEVSDADSYVIYRSVLTNGVWSDWNKLTEVSSSRLYYIDSAVNANVQYRYAVSAVVDGLETAYAGTEGIEYVPIITSLVAPEVTIKAGQKGIGVYWNEIDNALSYTVYRSTYNAKTGKWSGWSNIKAGYTGTSYIDTTVILGQKYKYTVRAVNGKVQSKYVESSSLTYNVKPTVKAANASNGVKVTWTPAANATGYTVYSSTYNTKTKKWSGWTNRGTAKATATSWVDKNAKSGTYYRYTVKARYNSVASSYNTTGSKTLFLAQPTVKIANNASGVKVSWNKVTGSKGYVVYRSEYVNGAWTSWKNMGTAKNTATSWVDKSVVSGVKYRYTVRVKNGDYLSTFTASNTVLYLAQPKVNAKAVSAGINVSWSKSDGAQGYTVYRREYNAKTKTWSGWKKMGTAGATKVSWTDKSVKSGVNYRYTVKAVSGSYASTYTSTGNVKK